VTPIRPETRDAYPKDWRQISHAIRFDRAGGRCECDGICGGFACSPRCVNEHGRPSRINNRMVVLTVAHLDHDPANCDEVNLMALCQACHLRYDREHHAETNRARRTDPDPGAQMLW